MLIGNKCDLKDEVGALPVRNAVRIAVQRSPPAAVAFRPQVAGAHCAPSIHRRLFLVSVALVPALVAARGDVLGGEPLRTGARLHVSGDVCADGREHR